VLLLIGKDFSTNWGLLQLWYESWCVTMHDTSSEVWCVTMHRHDASSKLDANMLNTHSITHTPTSALAANSDQQAQVAFGTARAWERRHSCFRHGKGTDSAGTLAACQCEGTAPQGVFLSLAVCPWHSVGSRMHVFIVYIRRCMQVWQTCRCQRSSCEASR